MGNKGTRRALVIATLALVVWVAYRHQAATDAAGRAAATATASPGAQWVGNPNGRILPVNHVPHPRARLPYYLRPRIFPRVRIFPPVFTWHGFGG